MKNSIAALILFAALCSADAAERTVVIVSTVAGTPGVAGFHDGSSTAAQFNHPTWLDVARIDSTRVRTGDLIVVDRLNRAIRLVGSNGVSTYSVSSTVSGPSPVVEFDFGGPFGGGLAVEPPRSGCGGSWYDSGMFVADTGSAQIAFVSMFGTLAARDDVEPWIGVANSPGSRDGLAGYIYASGTEAQFSEPSGLALSRGYPDAYPFQLRHVFVADTGNDTIREISFGSSFEVCPQTRSVTTIAGAAGEPGSRDGMGTNARFDHPRGLATGPDGSLYIADSGNHTIRRLAPDGSVTTIAGVAGVAGSDDGPAREAHLNTPSGIDVDESGTIYVADTMNHLIRMISPDGRLVTLAGTPGVSGFADGYGSAAEFAGPVGIRLAPDGSLLVADTSNNVIRRLTFVTVPGTRVRPARP